jgi:hypothetical protein
VIDDINTYKRFDERNEGGEVKKQTREYRTCFYNRARSSYNLLVSDSPIVKLFCDAAGIDEKWLAETIKKEYGELIYKKVPEKATQ